MGQSFEKPLISIVVPAYNDEETINDCLLSLVNQTYHDTEIIVVDDGSKDGTGNILEKMSEELTIRVIRTAHMGRSSARNVGMKHARGEIVAFAEADAKYHPDWLKNVIKHFNRSNVVGVVGPRYAWITNTLVSKCIDLELRIRYHDPLFKPTAGWTYRKEALLEIGGFDEQLVVAEDIDLGRRLMKKGYKISFEPDSLMWHREPTTLSELINRTYVHSRDRIHFYAKYPREYPFFKVLLFLSYLMLIPFSTLVIKGFSLLIIGGLPLILLLIQIFRLYIKSGRSVVERRLHHLFFMAVLSLIRNLVLTFASLSVLGTYLRQLLRRGET